MTDRQQCGQAAQGFLVNGEVCAKENIKKGAYSTDFATTELCNDLTHFSRN